MPRGLKPAPLQIDLRIMDLVVAVEVFILAITYSRTYTFFPEARSALNLTAAILPLAFVVPALFSRIYAALISIAIVAVLLLYQFWFSALWGTPFTATAFGTYQALLVTAMVAIYGRNGDPSRFLAVCFAALLCYLALYLYLYWSIDPAHVMRQQMKGEADFAAAIRRTHESRSGSMYQSEYKIGTSGAVMAYLVLYSSALLVSAKGVGKKLVAFLLVALALYALWIADSRFNMAATLVAVVVLMLPIGARFRAYGGASLATAGIVAYVIAAFSNYNIFALFANDQSGAERAAQFLIANPVFLGTPFLGVGLKNAGEDYAAVFNGDVFTADLGWYGELVQTGLLGMALLLFCHWFMARFVVRLSRERPGALAARMAGAYLVYLACVQFITPQLWEGAGAIFLCWVFAHASMRRRRIVHADGSHDLAMASARPGPVVSVMGARP